MWLPKYWLSQSSSRPMVRINHLLMPVEITDSMLTLGCTTFSLQVFGCVLLFSRIFALHDY